MKELILKITAAHSKDIFFMQLFSTVCLVYALFAGYSSFHWLVSFFIYFCTGCLGVTVTFHRYLSHKSYSMPKFFEYTFSLFGALGGTGSSLGWVALHRDHHKYSDGPMDPHSPRNGKVRLIFSQYNFSMNKWAVRDLISNRYHKLLHSYYHLVILAWALFWLWVGFEWFIFIVTVPVAIQIWISTASNILNHTTGYRNFETPEKSTNNFIIALISWGEGWHNNHHMYPSRWNFKVKWWEFDPSSLIIRLIKTK